MNLYYKEVIHKINCLTNDLDTLYHQVARKIGVADSVLIVSYMIYEKGDGCPLYDIYKEGGVSKQTINSAIRKLESEGLLFLEQDKGKRKRVWMTEKGKTYIEQTALRLLEVECNAFRDWNDEELEWYLKLMKKYNDAFRNEIEKMEES